MEEITLNDIPMLANKTSADDVYIAAEPYIVNNMEAHIYFSKFPIVKFKESSTVITSVPLIVVSSEELMHMKLCGHYKHIRHCYKLSMYIDGFGATYRAFLIKGEL